MNLIRLILLTLNVSIALTVVALGLKSTLSDATFLLRRPHHLARAFLSMNVLMPLLALLLAIAFDLHPAVKIALVTLSVSPVPPMFPKQALKAGCKEDYALGLLVAAALLAIVLVPLTLEIVQMIVGVPLQMPVRNIATLIFKTVLAPLLAGIGVRAWAPSFAERRAELIGRLASALLIFSVLPIIFAFARVTLSLIGNGTLLSLTAFALAGRIIGQLFGGPEPENRRVLSMATASRHPAVAAAVAQANFPGQKLAVPAIALYLIVAAILSALASALRRREEKKVSAGGRQRAA